MKCSSNDMVIRYSVNYTPSREITIQNASAATPQNCPECDPSGNRPPTTPPPPPPPTTTTIPQKLQIREITIPNVPIREKFVLTINMTTDQINVFINGVLSGSRSNSADKLISIVKNGAVVQQPFIYINYNDPGTEFRGNYSDFQFFTTNMLTQQQIIINTFKLLETPFPKPESSELCGV